MKFKYNDWRERKQQQFDKDKITLKKAGKEFNVYQWIQEAREDTEVIPTLEKYGCIDRMILNKEEMYQDFTNFKDLRTLNDQIKKADEMFNNLPIEIKQKFGNNKSMFMAEGEKWLTEEIKKEQEKNKPVVTETTSNEGVETNE